MIFNFCHKNVPASELFADGERGRANWVTSNCVAHRICNETILCDEGIDNPSGAQRSSELLVRVLSLCLAWLRLINIKLCGQAFIVLGGCVCVI